MPTSLTSMVQLIGPWVLLVATVVAAAGYVARRRAHIRQLVSEGDNLIQTSQGFILALQGIINELDAEHPIRKRLESALDCANLELSHIRERMEQHCHQV